MNDPVEASSWRRLWFVLRTLAVRGRFLTGKASFVETRVEEAQSRISEVFDSRGQPRGQRKLRHYQLRSLPPRTGSQGFALFSQCELAGGPGRLVRLACGWCSHHFFIRVPETLLEGREGPDARPASYTSPWFRFLGEDFEGQASLSCPHCEQSGQPEVRFLPTGS